jgi:hypothetical protein
MTRRVIASVAIGAHEELSGLSINNLEKFAKNFSYEISICRVSLDINRPPSWTKVLHIMNLMKEFDEIFWIDSDAIIVDYTQDIRSEVHQNSELSWVYHDYDNQTHPNAGVMYIKVNAKTWKLFQLAYQQNDLINHPWWEQAALMRILGMDSTVWPIGTGTDLEKLEIIEQKLSKEWNSVRQDPANKVRIRHFAGEQMWVRKLLMAEYANPFGNAPYILSDMLKHEFPIDNKVANQELLAQNEQLLAQNFAITNSKTWKFFSLYRWIKKLIISAVANNSN